MRTILRPVAVLAALLALAACGETDVAAPGTEDQTAEEGDVTQQGDDGVEVTGDLGTKPQITTAGGEPPAELVIRDLVEGDGAAVEPGATVTIDYVGVVYDGGQEFDSSWDRGEPAMFPLGNLIGGWQEGIPGMQAGGRRLLVIPPELAYGDAPPPGIPAGATLAFVIDLISTP